MGATLTIGLGLGAVIAALVAAYLAKELKVSEFRQAWINGLRDEISDFLRKAREWSDLYKDFNTEDDSAGKINYMEELDALAYDAYHIHGSISLRFKPDDANGNELLTKLLDLIDPGKYGDRELSRWPKLYAEALNCSRKLLKEEWEVAKEPLPSIAIKPVRRLIKRFIPKQERKWVNLIALLIFVASIVWTISVLTYCKENVTVTIKGCSGSPECTKTGTLRMAFDGSLYVQSADGIETVYPDRSKIEYKEYSKTKGKDVEKPSSEISK